MGVEGELVVRIDTRAGRVNAISARAVRPRVGPTLFVGRRAAEVPALARSLFSVCGRSQAIAAHSAIEAVEGIAPDEAEITARARAVSLETLQEHVWKIFVDMPRLLGREPEIALLAEVRRAIAAASVASILPWSRRALFEPAEFLELDGEEGLRSWMRAARTPGAAICAAALALDPALGASDVALLPPADRAWVAGPLAAEIDARADFDATPALGGQPRETGPIARTASHPLVAAAIGSWGRGVGARLVARLVETAQLIKGTGTGTRPLDGFGGARTSDGAGAGWAETARGLVVHRVALDGDRVANYRIVAPTEWNFHPEGAFARGAHGLEGDRDSIDANVQRLVASLDPCVAVRYEARHA